jgi:hypothetical protein
VRHPDFTRLNLAAGGAITEHRVLVTMCHNLFFVVAHTDDRTAALDQATDLNRQHEGFRPVYTVLLTDEHLAALADGAGHLNVTVLSAARRRAPTPIKVNNRAGVDVLTARGLTATTVTTTGDLHAGDVYTCGTPTLGSDEPGHTVYRALADYNPATGEARHHIVTTDWTPADDTGALTDGPDTVVYRVNGEHPPKAKAFGRVFLIYENDGARNA